ncbi:MAG: hypothetical protein Q4D50_09720 [Eubacteriales bacterium]|nr:hypothetical protein [Eubacteriales bacterium]
MKKKQTRTRRLFGWGKFPTIYIGGTCDGYEKIKRTIGNFEGEFGFFPFYGGRKVRNLFLLCTQRELLSMPGKAGL